MKAYLLRLFNALMEVGHSYVNVFVEILKPVMPWITPTIRWDNNNGFVIDDKPLGYTVGHILAYLAALPILAVTGNIAHFLLTAILSMLGADVRF